jgi:hypothetical protein
MVQILNIYVSLPEGRDPRWMLTLFVVNRISFLACFSFWSFRCWDIPALSPASALIKAPFWAPLRVREPNAVAWTELFDFPRRLGPFDQEKMTGVPPAPFSYLLNDR